MKTLCGFALVIMAAHPALASDPTPDIKAKLQDLAFLEGTWKCEGKGLDPVSDKIIETSDTMMVAAVMGGTWLQISRSSATSPFTSVMFLGYDNAWERYVLGGITSLGSWSTSSATGLANSVLTSTGRLQNFQGRSNVETYQTLRRVSHDALNVVSQIRASNGAWEVVYDGACLRS